MNITDVMTKKISSCHKNSLIADCAQQMNKLNIGAVPILDENDQLVGIITDRDITVRAVAQGIDLSQARVGDFMTPSPLTVEPNTSLEEAAEIMSMHQIRRLPVQQKGKLLGMVSMGDLAASDADEKIACHVLQDVSLPVAH